MSDDSKIFVKELSQALMSATGNRALNTNSYISIGLFFTILVGTLAVVNSVYTAKAEISTRLERVEFRESAIEKKNADWTFKDMFKWCVHLQRDNPQVKVPEPEHTNE